MESTMVCRDRHGLINASFFPIWACFQCYLHLFPEKQTTYSTSSDILGTEEFEEPLPSISVFWDKQETLCSSLNDRNCQRLTACCQAAEECCNNQIKASTLSSLMPNKHSSCPMTWDGYACFPSTPAGHVAEVACPSYISDRTSESGVASKQCTENASWWRNRPLDMEWTDYTKCVSIEAYYVIYYVSVVCSIGSLICLVPACIIFLSVKQLRKQHRIHIHLNLFVSFTLTNCVWLTWDHLIFKDRLENPREVAIMHQHIIGCRVLYMMSRVSWTCNIAWMSLEGFHLHRLISQAFQTPKTISSYYFIGWVFPLLPTGIYALVRFLSSNQGCWVSHAGYYEWIIYSPNILCILLNIFFLANVLRTLVTQIQRHNNEPSNYRRALKATMLLVPLFGLQLLLVIYRPGGDIRQHVTYEVFTKIINNSQGLVVTAVFCFMNGEVHYLLKGRLVCRKHHESNPDIISGSVSVVRRGSPRGSSSHMDGYAMRKLPQREETANHLGAGCRKLKVSKVSAGKRPLRICLKHREKHLTNTTTL